MEKKSRRKYTQEFKEESVKLVTEQGYSVAEAARNLGVNPNLLTKWKNKMQDWQAAGITNPQVLQEELRRLRKENKNLKMEREILKKAAAFFAKESK